MPLIKKKVSATATKKNSSLLLTMVHEEGGTRAPRPPSSAVAPPSTKRYREEEFEGSLTCAELQPIKRRAVLGQDILFRILLPSKQIGKVIGRGGNRIQKIREETKATIKIADAIAVS